MSKLRRAVDWREVERELESLPEAFKEQGKFDSLPHVIEILRALDPSQALVELRDQQENIESLVDDIVKGYHGGFNKSIHNYSEILKLFTEAQTQSKSIRASLLALKKQLGSRTTQLRKHWQRSTVLRHTLTILDDIEKIAHVPKQVDSLCGIESDSDDDRGDRKTTTYSSSIKSQDRTSGRTSVGQSSDELHCYETSTDLLCFALEKLGEHEDLRQVRALCEMEENILAKKEMVKGQIRNEIHNYLYRKETSFLQMKAQHVSTRSRTLSLQSPVRSVNKERTMLQKLLRCVVRLDNGKDMVSTAVLDDFKPRLQKWIKGYWKEVEPYHGSSLSSPKATSNTVLCDRNLVKYTNKHFLAMCKELEKIFDRHLELSRAIQISRNEMSRGETKVVVDDFIEEETFMREIWSHMQRECISMLCTLLGVQLPENMMKTKKISEGLSRRNRSIMNSESGNSLKFSFFSKQSKKKNGNTAGSSTQSPSSADSRGRPATLGYHGVLNTCIDEEFRGIYLMVGVHGPLQELIKHVSGTLSMEKESEEQRLNSSRMLFFLEDHILEDFVPIVKNDCTSKLKMMMNHSDHNSDHGTTMHKRSHSRDLDSAIDTSSREETKVLISVVQQLVDFAKVFPKYVSHFSAVLESMLMHFLSSATKWGQGLDGALSSKLASNVSICSIMSQESYALNLLSEDYFILEDSRKSIKAVELKGGSERGNDFLLQELQKLRPVSSDNLYKSTSKLAANSKNTFNMQKLVESVEDFMGNVTREGEKESYPLDGLRDLMKGLKVKIGYILRTLRLEMKIKMLAVTQHLESFAAVANLGCESVDSQSVNTSALAENCSPYVLILTSTLRQCSNTLFPLMAKNHFSYVFGDIEDWVGLILKSTLVNKIAIDVSDMKVASKDLSVLQRSLRNIKYVEGGKKLDDCRLWYELLMMEVPDVISYISENPTKFQFNDLKNLIDTFCKKGNVTEKDRINLKALVLM